MIGALYFGEYLTAGLASYAPSAALRVNVGGAELGLASGVTVSQSMSGQATASFTTRDQRPVPFSVCRFGVGSLTPNDLVFNGEVQDSDQALDETSIRWDAKGIDSSQQFNRHLVFATFTTFTNIDAGFALKSLIAAYAPDFTSNNVQTGIGNITLAWAGETMDTVVTAIAQAIGGYAYRDLAYDVHLFITETPDMTPDPLDANNQTLLVGTLQFDANVSQTRNRALGIGVSTQVPGAVLAGDSILPVSNSTPFSAVGGKALVGSQIVSYAGKSQSTPLLAPIVLPNAGAGKTNGSHQWGYTYVTAAGETVCSPLSNPVVMETLGASPAISSLVANPNPSGGMIHDSSGLYALAIIKDYASFVTYGRGVSSGISDLGATTAFTAVPQGTGYYTAYTASFVQAASTINRGIGLFLSVDGGINWYLRMATSFSAAVGTTVSFFTDYFPATYWISYPTQIGISGIAGPIGAWSGKSQVNQAYFQTSPIGPVGTTARKVYSTPVGGPPPLLQQTVADNVSPFSADATPDGSLGAAAPSSDTSGLVLLFVTTTNGAVAIGATSMALVSSTGFSATGGWALVASMAIRYTGLSGNSLTGIPALGIGAVLAAIPTAQQVTNTLVLNGIPTSGVGALTAPLLSGTSCSLFSQRDNLASQALVASIEGVNAKGVASDGIYEVKITDSSQITQAALDAILDADLAQYASALGVITVTYSTYDRKSYVGRPVTVNRPDMGLSGTFVIQTVTVTFNDNGLPPVYQCVASSVRYSLQDLLKHLVMAA